MRTPLQPTCSPRPRGIALAPLLVLLLLWGSGCEGVTDEGGTVGTAAELRDALAAASAGDTIQLAAGRYVGSFEVPAGVTLAGEEGAIIAASGGAGLRLAGGAPDVPTTLRGVTVRTESGTAAAAAVLGLGGDFIALEDVAVEAEVGVGALFENVGEISLRGVRLEGTLDEASLASLLARSNTVRASDFALMGLVVLSGDGDKRPLVRMREVEVSRFAGFGVVVVDAMLDWNGGSVTETAGTGVYLQRTEGSIEDVSVTRVLSAPTSNLFPVGYGVLVTDDSSLSTQRMTVAGVSGVGLLQDASRSQHAEARIADNARVGVWVQNSRALSADDPEVLFDNSVLVRNTGAGIQIVDGGGVVFRRGVIADTRIGVGLVSQAGAEVHGDGIQVNGLVAGAGTAVRLADTVVLGNGRAGVAAAGSGARLAASTAEPVSVCGHTRIANDWTCTRNAAGDEECVRTAGPPVNDGWTCSDGSEGLECAATDPALAEAEPEVAQSHGLERLPEHCGGEVERVLGDAGALLDLVAGAVESRVVVGENGYRWSCSNSGDTRTCRNTAFAQPGRALDNPTLDNGAGWTCSDGAAGRTCTWAGLGVAVAADVDGGTTLEVSTESRVADRDALLRDGTLPMLGLQDGLSRARLPAFLTDGASVVGENGIVRQDGQIGDAAVVGENGRMEL
ncbi:MAG: hypothetical protein EA398_13810 [Deltaproteobacteria bacterium]|nr:MAG: hypothetical protein EA398_13810 [Deltaproteobacteria bacterium]